MMPMGTETLFRIVTAGLLLVAFTVSGYYRRRAERRGGKLNSAQGQRLLIPLRLLGLTAFIPLLLYLVNPAWVAWARIDLPGWLRWSGAVLALGMLPGLVWMFHTLGVNISPTQATRTGHHLVTNGPYRWIRHPLYTFGGLFFLGVGLLTGLWWLVALLAVGLAVLVWRTASEEANLIAQFGDEYRAYMARTGRYFPRWGSR
jgi:protein-S-isoprenylcysteine O-methyltransferase Ste14